MNYQQYLQSDHWKKTAAAARVRANNRCQVCGSEKNIDVHHNSYQRLGQEEPFDLVCLCHLCHEIYHFTDAVLTDEPLPDVIIFHGKSDSSWS